MVYNKIQLNYEKNLNNIGITSGNYNIIYNIFKNIVGDAYDNHLYISEISNSRLEIKVKKVHNDNNNINFLTLTAINNKLDNYIINFGNNEYYLIINWIVAKNGQSAILKLASKLPSHIAVKQQLWIAQIIATPIEQSISLQKTTQKRAGHALKSANFDINVNNINNNQSTTYQTWDSLLSTNNNTIDKILHYTLSSSNLDTTELDNVDYSDYNNFVHFGSATERLKNFKYKLQLIEAYNEQINTLYNFTTSSYSGVSQSIDTYQTFVNRKQQVINTFDGYESYLYYQSSSNITEQQSSGFGAEASSTWPKSGSYENWSLYSVTSSEGTEWFASQSLVAEQYDKENVHCLINLLPQYLLMSEYNNETTVVYNSSSLQVETSHDGNYDNSNNAFLTFIYMIGHHFDLYWLYIKNILSIYNRSNNKIQGVASELLQHVLKSLGLDINNDQLLSTLWQYYLATDKNGIYAQTGSISNPLYAISKRDYTNEINNRLLNNLPFLYKSKGSERSVRALLNCYGIPDTLLCIKEYGGPQLQQQQQFYNYDYALYISNNENGYISSNYAVDMTGTGNEAPQSIELRFLTAATTEQQLLEMQSSVDNAYWNLLLQPSASDSNLAKLTLTDNTASLSTDYLPIISNNINDSQDFYNVLIAFDFFNNVATLSIKNSKYNKIFYQSTVSASATEIPSLFSNWIATDDNAKLYIGRNFTGSLQEFRSWRINIDNKSFNEHVLFNKSLYISASDNIVDPQNTYLMTHYSFNDKKNYYQYPEIEDIKSNTAVLNDGVALNFADEINSYSYKVLQTVNNTLTNWNSDKVRIESSSLNNNGLSFLQHNSTYQFDTASIDSNKIGIFLSPANVINQDILTVLGNNSYDNYIGDPSDLYNDNYKDLQQFNKSYFNKYTAANNFNQYLKYVKIIDNTLFTLLKNFLPARSKQILGIVIEPHILNRSKNTIIKYRPQIEQRHYEQNIYYNDYNKINSEYKLYNSNITVSNNYYIKSNKNNYRSSMYYTVASLSRSAYTPYISASVYYDSSHIYQGIQQTSNTTVQGESPVQIFINNPNKLVVDDDNGDARLKIK